ncbi:DUF2000 family protein [Streptomyces kanamyceticus]|uniref:DUF2000 family protein n=1 Tax=Streptomyces kanamyceticus TaxID=1967 RepID=UPI0037DD89E4
MQRTYKTGARGDRQSRRMSTDTATTPTPPAATAATATATDRPPVRFDTKIAVLLRDDLESWQRLNVTAFLVSGLGTRLPELIGEPYEDADGTAYLPMFRQPVLVLEGGKEVLTAARRRALGRGLPCSVFTSDLFATGNDTDNRAAVRAVAGDELDVVGLAVHGPRGAVDKVLKGARMHP